MEKVYTGVMDGFEERFNEIIKNYNEAKISGDKNLTEELIYFDFRGLLQEQYEHLNGVVGDSQYFVGKGINQGSVDYFVQNKEVLEGIVFDRWDEFSHKLKNEGFSNLPKIIKNDN